MGRKLINQLNDLTGAEWLYWTDTIYITNFPPDQTHHLRKAHGAMKPPELMADIIKFFTKAGEFVLDPFAGVGGTLLGAALSNRNALGFELNPLWYEVYMNICQLFTINKEGHLLKKENLDKQEGIRFPEMRLGDCLELMATLPDESVDAVITDPPYGCQNRLAGFKTETNFNMFNDAEAKDLANAEDFPTFLKLMQSVGTEMWRILKKKKYLIMLVGDRYKDGEYIPLGYLVGQAMKEVGFKLKGIKIWCNKSTQRPLKPYAVMHSFVPNITHQNILILRKE